MSTPRTNPGLVIALFAVGGQEYDGVTDLVPYIRRAHNDVNKVQQMAALKGLPLSFGPGDDGSVDGVNGDLEFLERYLAAHWYCVSDPQYTSRSTNGKSGSFARGSPDKGYGETSYGRAAIAMDYSGCLENINQKQRARFTWLGKPPSAQIPWWDRS